ncbi:MAG: dihydropteroate synthase [Culicoidibacterales bacterium]
MQIMGILNVTPDSFSDGGAYIDVTRAVTQAKYLLATGATIIDVGGETTRPGAEPVSVAVELQRVIPVIQAVTKFGCEISIDTYKAEVAKAAIQAGATYINDVSGALYDSEMKVVAATMGVPIILMHNRFAPGQTPHARQVVESYTDVYSEIKQQLQLSVDLCLEAGVKPSQIILDPGIGFAKTSADTQIILPLLDRLRIELGYPFLLGVSRKRFLGPYLSEDSQQQRDVATAMLSVYAKQSGCSYVRVHDVASTKTAIDIWDFVQEK